MSVVHGVEISSTSLKSFEDAMQQGIDRASKTLGEVRSAWIKEEQIDVEKGRIVAYTVTMTVTVVLEESPAQPG